MQIGTPKEIKENETRVAMVPSLAGKLTQEGHTVWVQSGAGVSSGFSDEDYKAVGARILDAAGEIYARADFVTKVTELQPAEFDLLREHQMVMTWFHLAEDYDRPMAQALLDHRSIALSMELIVADNGDRPTMKPMSDIAGSLAMLESVKYCQTINGGTGLLPRRIYGLPTPNVVVLGGGNAGLNAAQVAAGLGLRVTVVEASLQRLDFLKVALPNADVVCFEENLLKQLLSDCDIFINCVYPSPEAGKREPIVSRDTVRAMKRCSLIMDIAGAGIVETSHYTTLAEPTFREEGILHYCVPNMPSLCPRTSTQALLMITAPYILAIARKGLRKAVEDDASLRRCVSTVNGKIVHPEIGVNQEMPYTVFDLSMLDGLPL
ncbi:MAG: alanine dehydrogenase [Clostridiales Family XIII bacterium]|jgi:alanine dehydrogenase|nr:alanine dehydrogenase [Clostridiales Family XIII bacterium]